MFKRFDELLEKDSFYVFLKLLLAICIISIIICVYNLLIM